VAFENAGQLTASKSLKMDLLLILTLGVERSGKGTLTVLQDHALQVKVSASHMGTFMTFEISSVAVNHSLPLGRLSTIFCEQQVYGI
jgi:hypothetical protein